MSETARLDAGALPRVSARAAAGAWLATRVLGRVPRRLEVIAGGFGAVGLAWEGVGAPDTLGPDAVTFVLVRGRETGRLALDGALANRIVAAALGAGVELAPVLGTLGHASRGLVAGFVASVLHAAGAPLAVSLARAGGAGHSRDGVSVAIRVAAAGGEGWAVLEAPRAWLDDAVRLPAEPDELRGLTVQAALELGRTTLVRRELVELGPGDAVVFDGAPALAGDAAWSARLVVGDYAAEAAVEEEGGVSVTGEFKRAREGEGRRGETARDGRDTTLLAELPVEIVIELARFSLRGDELLALGPGAVVPVGSVRGPDVVLRVAGEAWAEGELVDVEGELAVRVTRTLRAR